MNILVTHTDSSTQQPQLCGDFLKSPWAFHQKSWILENELLIEGEGVTVDRPFKETIQFQLWNTLLGQYKSVAVACLWSAFAHTIDIKVITINYGMFTRDS